MPYKKFTINGHKLVYHFETAISINTGYILGI